VSDFYNITAHGAEYVGKEKNKTRSYVPESVVLMEQFVWR
jgi:hypothetical protein